MFRPKYLPFLLLLPVYSLFHSIFLWNVSDVNTLYKLNFSENIGFWYSLTWVTYYQFYLLWATLLVTLITYRAARPNFWVVLVVLLYAHDALSITFCDLTFREFEVVYRSTNVFLLNKLNKIHPLLFFVTTSLLLLVSGLTDKFCHTRSRLQLANYQRGMGDRTFSTFLISLTFLGLGGWWASQEGSWGGWWGWDPSEFLGFCFALTAIFTLHARSDPQSSESLSHNLNLLTISISFLFSVLQISFELVSHNFGIKFFFFFNNTFLFLEILLSAPLTTVAVFNRVYLTSLRQVTPKSRRGAWLGEVGTLLLLLPLLVSTFALVLNALIWKMFSLDIFNSTIPLRTITVLPVYLLMYWVINRLHYCWLWPQVWQLSLLPSLPPLTFQRNGMVLRRHTPVLLFLLICVLQTSSPIPLGASYFERAFESGSVAILFLADTSYQSSVSPLQISLRREFTTTGVSSLLSALSHILNFTMGNEFPMKFNRFLDPSNSLLLLMLPSVSIFWVAKRLKTSSTV